MRKLILTFAACVCMAFLSHAQECEVIPYRALDMMYPATQLNYPGKRELVLSKFDLINPPVKNLSSNRLYKAYIAPSDSTIMVFLTGDQISFFKLCSSEKECNRFQLELYIEQVIIEEFNRLQPAGIFQGTAAEADSVIRHIVQAIRNKFLMNSTTEKSNPENLDSYKITFSNVIYSPYNTVDGKDYVELTNPVSALCNYEKTSQDIDFCGLIDTVRQCGTDFIKGTSTALKYPVQRAVSPGTKFQAFDMNGNFIRSGKWNENSAEEFRTPTIVRFENGFTICLKRQTHRKVHVQ